MELGRRIEQRLGELGISQAELARRAQIPQTTVNSLIRSGRRSTPHLVRIARELQTTPAWLTGEADDLGADTSAMTLSSQDRALIELFHTLELSGQKAVIEIVRTMAQAALAGPVTERPEKVSARAVASHKAKSISREAVR